MLTAIYADDERYNHVLLKNCLQDHPDISLVASYDNAEQVLANCKCQPDIAFIDIQMPEMDGIELAQRLKEKWERTDIVFLTAYSEYAIDAFRVNATDYLVKPVDRTELKRVLDKIRKNRGLANTPQTMLAVLGGIEIIRNGVYHAIAWPTQKTKELFAYLLLNRGVFTDKLKLCDLLWPGTDEEKAFTNLYTTVYRLKAVLRSEELEASIESKNGAYWLILSKCQVDYESFEQAVHALNMLSSVTKSELCAAEALYRGDLFGSEGYLWAFGKREALKNDYLSLLYRLVRAEGDGHEGDAISVYHKILFSFPYEEKAMLELIRLYDRLGQVEDLKKYYAYYESLLAEQLDARPSSAVLSLYCQVVNKKR